MKQVRGRQAKAERKSEGVWSAKLNEMGIEESEIREEKSARGETVKCEVWKVQSDVSIESTFHCLDIGV